ncbi:unnamed protein product [Protopolystoma xenopodis]|uniref:Rho-GAP domain-containing protein n=1 Tax=Protopolystoma xenopodis TaxID=117903 RepID=A0A448XIS4_9PLAT|nr:unnamed protein product [Protopolystoma xenopodis]
MIFRSDDVRHLTDESLAPFYRNRRRLPRKQRQHESSSKTNRQLSRGIRHRVLVESTFESLHPTPSPEMEVSSTKRDSKSRLVYLKSIALRLPTEHRVNAAYLLHFLARLASYAGHNRMTPVNLGIVFGPNLLAPGAANPLNAGLTSPGLAGNSPIVSKRTAHSLLVSPSPSPSPTSPLPLPARLASSQTGFTSTTTSSNTGCGANASGKSAGASRRAPSDATASARRASSKPSVCEASEEAAKPFEPGLGGNPDRSKLGVGADDLCASDMYMTCHNLITISSIFRI